MKRFAGIAALLAVAVMSVVIVRGGDDPYEVAMRLDNAAGLRDGSPVVVGGVSVGTVRLEATRRDVEVTLRIDRDHAPIGRNARAEIAAQNVLGQKQVRLDTGDVRREPAPDGYVLPRRQTRTSTDLDQLLSTLDAPTRTRLAIVINELGTAFAGRRMDFKTFVGDVVPALESGSDVLGQLAAENHRLGTLLHNSDAFISELADSRQRVADGLDSVGRATETVAARRTALRETLRRAPATLRTARVFLGELRSTTGPLAAAARRLSATAPQLRATLERLAPFTKDAAPALKAAAEQSAPALVRLAGTDRAAGALRAPLANGERLVREQLPGAGDAVGGSVDNITALLENWSRAIQFRDGISHIFRGEASFSPAMYSRIIARLGGKPAARRRVDRKRPKQSDSAPAAKPATPAESPRPKLPIPALDKPVEAVKKILDDLAGRLTDKPKDTPSGRPVTGLLDYLLKP